MKLTVQTLRNHGFKVRVIHQRKREYFIPHSSQTRLAAKGGKTVVELRTPDGREFIGEAICRGDENYVKKTGVDYALSRAFVQAWISE